MKGSYILPARIGYDLITGDGILRFTRVDWEQKIVVTEVVDGYAYGHIADHPEFKVRLAPVARAKLQESKS